RRMLAADARREAEDGRDGAARPAGARRLGLALALTLPVFAGGLYVWLGSPGVPSQPFAARRDAPVDPRVAQVLERLEAAVAAKPDDLSAWLQLGQAHWSLQRWPEAAESFGRAWKLAPKRSDIGSAHAEALVRASRGVVTRAAQRA